MNKEKELMKEYAKYFINLLKDKFKDETSYRYKVIFSKDESNRRYSVSLCIDIDNSNTKDQVIFITDKRLKNLSQEDKLKFTGNFYNASIMGKSKDEFSIKDAKKDFLHICDFNYLRNKENIGEILVDGTVKKEYFRQGYIYKNFANFYRKEGICYISEYQTDKITKKSKPGNDYETYHTIFEKVREAFEKEKVNKEKYSIKDFTETIMNDLDWQTADSLILEYIEALDEECFLDYEEDLENEE